MIRLTKKCAPVDRPCGIFRLGFDARQKARQRVHTEDADEVGIVLERGTTLKHGDHLSSESGEVYRVEANEEEVCVVRCADRRELAKAAYHLGNRHVRVQVGEDWVAFPPDHVLEHMLADLGFTVEQTVLRFEPEPGAYHQHEAASRRTDHEAYGEVR